MNSWRNKKPVIVLLWYDLGLVQKEQVDGNRRKHIVGGQAQNKFIEQV